MKQIATSLGVGACLLISWAGVVQADNPHISGTGTGMKGQPGAFNTTLTPALPGNVCGAIAGFGPTAQGMPGSGKGVGSPFGPNGSAKTYAGNTGNPTGGGNANGTVANNSAHAVSEYDVACFQATQHQHLP